MRLRLPEIRKIIEATVESDTGVFDPRVVDALCNIPPGYMLPGGYIEVEPVDLQKAIRDLVNYATSRGNLDANGVAEAMQANVCHYLWLC